MSNAIFEIFSEELPATLQKKIAVDYKQFAEKELKILGITVKSENIFVGITLNRLVLKLENAKISQEQLLNFVDKTLKDFSKAFLRTMCYPQLEVRWLRPIRGLFACVDNQVLSGKFYGIELTNGTHINKFDFVKCSGFDEYIGLLAHEEIEIDYQKRFEFVKSEIDNFAKKQDQEYRNTKLMEEIAGMSEYCTKPMVSTLDARFNVLPFELIELVLRENQRYVVFRPNDKKEIKFLIFGDKITADTAKRDNIVRGHRKVVNARLDDALYYWQMDEKEQKRFGNMEKYQEYLKGLLLNRIFIDDITWKSYLEDQVYATDCFCRDDGIAEGVKDLIYGTKLDLVTHVVGEFPELQGVIGGYYDLISNYCSSTYPKYLYFNPYNIDTAQSREDLFFCIIDRIVYICLMYQQGKQPTGSGDKYKVKTRMDEVVKILCEYGENYFLEIALQKTIYEIIETVTDNYEKLTQGYAYLSKDKDIFELFVKRYQKYIEDSYRDKYENIKKFSSACGLVVKKNKDIIKRQNLEKILSLLKDKDYITVRKRINGYTKNVDFVENELVLKRAKEIYKNEDIKTIAEFLDDHKIDGDNLTKQALKWIDVEYFEPDLPAEFLEIV